MAKRTNIVRIIKNEIEKGNKYICANGNLVSEEMVTGGIKAEFIKGLNSGEIPVNKSLEEYTKETVGNMTKAEDFLKYFDSYFDKEEPANAEPVEGADAQ